MAGGGITGRFSVVPSRAFFDRRLDGTDMLVLGLICSYADRDGWCFPSQSTMSKLLGISKRTVIRHVQKLVDNGYIVSRRRTRENGSSTSNLYRVLYDADTPPEFDSMPEDMPEVPEVPVADEPAKKTAVGVAPAKSNAYVISKKLAELCNMDWGANKGMLMAEAKKLMLLDGFNLEQAVRLFGKPNGVWWSADFRGKRGSYPVPSQIRSLWNVLAEQVKDEKVVGDKEGWLYV